MRIAFFGLPLAACLLSADGFTPALTVLPPGAAPGRRRVSRRLPTTLVDAGGRGPREVEARVDAWFAEGAPDLVVSWYFTRKIAERWLLASRLGGVGAHPSLLPRHRGPNPFFWAIDSGDIETGVTVHRLTAGYDEGDVLDAERIPVGDRDSWQLARALDRPSLRLLRRTVRLAAAGTLPPGVPQDARSATWAPEPDDEQVRIDLFKRVNDRHGHPAGDEVLRAVAAIIKGQLRTEDVFARYGGEEFAVLLRDTAIPEAAHVAERIRERVARAAIDVAGTTLTVTVSAGCAALTCCRETTGQEMVDVADRRLYRAKHAGRNRVIRDEA